MFTERSEEGWSDVHHWMLHWTPKYVADPIQPQATFNLTKQNIFQIGDKRLCDVLLPLTI
jgi:hypothetical protein